MVGGTRSVQAGGEHIWWGNNSQHNPLVHSDKVGSCGKAFHQVHKRHNKCPLPLFLEVFRLGGGLLFTAKLSSYLLCKSPAVYAQLSSAPSSLQAWCKVNWTSMVLDNTRADQSAHRIWHIFGAVWPCAYRFLRARLSKPDYIATWDYMKARLFSLISAFQRCSRSITIWICMTHWQHCRYKHEGSLHVRSHKTSKQWLFYKTEYDLKTEQKPCDQGQVWIIKINPEVWHALRFEGQTNVYLCPWT